MLLLSPTSLGVAHALPTVQVLAGTEIQVVLSREHDLAAGRGDEALARVTLLSDAGTPLASQPIMVKLQVNGQVAEQTLTTDEEGGVDVTVPAGAVSIAASFAGQGGFAASAALPFRFEPNPASKPTARSLEVDTLGLWPWLVSLVILGGLTSLRALRTKPRNNASRPRSNRAPVGAPPAREHTVRPPPAPHVVVVDADLGLPIAGACMVSPDGSPTPLSTSDLRGRLRLPRDTSTSAYLVQAEGYESRTVFAGQLAPPSGGHVVLPLRNLRGALWERLQRTAGVALGPGSSGAQRSPAQWARRHTPGAGAALAAIEQALFAAAPMTPGQVDALDAALKRALSGGSGPESPAKPASDRESQ